MRDQLRSLWTNRDLQRNSGLALATTVVSVLTGLVSAPILAHLLPRKEYGMLSYVASLQGLVIAFSSPGHASAISFSTARGCEAHFREGTLQRVRIYLRNGLALLAVAAWYLWMERQPDMALIIALGGFLLPWTHAFDTGEQFLVGRSDFTAIFWRRMLTVILIAVSSLISAWLFPTSFSVLLGRGLVSALMYISIFLVLLQTVRNNRHDAEFEAKSRGFSIVSITGMVAGQTDRLVLGLVGDLGLLAGYSLSQSITAPLDALTKSLNKIVFGKVASPRSQHQRRFWLLLSIAFAAVGSISIVVAWNIALPIVHKLFPKYPELSRMVPVLLVARVLNSGTSIALVYSQFHAFDVWKKFQVAASISSVVVIAIATWAGGVWGALWSNLAYAAISFLFFNAILWRDVDVKNGAVLSESIIELRESLPPSSQ